MYIVYIIYILCKYIYIYIILIYVRFIYCTFNHILEVDFFWVPEAKVEPTWTLKPPKLTKVTGPTNIVT